jgi:hypothetical protein
VWIKTLHGKFVFPLQKYQGHEQGTSYFKLTNQLQEGFVSPRLQELCGYYSNRLSYKEVERLVERVTGDCLLSDQGIWHIVNTKAQAVSQQLQQGVASTLVQTPLSTLDVNSQIDLYDSTTREILLFDDAIGVKGQRAQRYSQSLPTEAKEDKAPAVISDIVMLQKPTGDFEYMAAPINESGEALLSLSDVVRAKLLQLYGKQRQPLNIVALTDGAKAIRTRLQAIFGTAVVLILDWYHLCRKLRSFLSMIAFNKAERSMYLKFLLSQLWQGKTTVVLEYLKHQVVPRNQDKLQELIGYLERHQSEIIDYNRRSRAGKTIGSGRMEKGVDLVVGHRQKNKGMSWRPQGSKALSLLRIAELNGQWSQLWFPALVA